MGRLRSAHPALSVGPAAVAGLIVRRAVLGKRRAHHVVRHRWRSYSGPGEGNLAPLAPRTVGVMPKGKAPRSKIISVGSDFAGLGTVYKAVRKVVSKLPRTKARYVFACDKNPVCMKLAVQADAPDVWYEDVADRDVQTMPAVDVFSFTGPCPSWSNIGRRAPGDLRGHDDPRGGLGTLSLEYVRVHKPRVLLSENVATLGQQFKPHSDRVVLAIESMGYCVQTRILNTNEYGIPHHRRRWYLMGIRDDCLRDRVKSARYKWWPDPCGYTVPLSTLVTPLPPDDLKMLPDNCVRHRANVEWAYQDVVRKGINPFSTPVVVDMDCSESYRQYKIAECPTLTRSRAASMMYWCSTKGAPLNVTEMAALQGFGSTDFDWKSAGVTASQFAGCLGDAQSLNLVMAIIPHMLYMSKQITAEEYDLLVTHAV